MQLTEEIKKLFLKVDRLGKDVIDNGKAFHIFGPL